MAQLRAGRIGLISDTHGLLRPEAVRALQGVDRIIHAGDVGKSEVLDTLRRIAPVSAVRGNVDRGEWAEALPLTTVVEPGIFVIHDVHDIDGDPAAAGYHAVITGHSHRPGSSVRNGVLYVNPGSAGPRRFRLPVTLGILDLSATPWRVEMIELPVSLPGNI